MNNLYKIRNQFVAYCLTQVLVFSLGKQRVQGAKINPKWSPLFWHFAFLGQPLLKLITFLAAIQLGVANVPYIWHSWMCQLQLWWTNTTMQWALDDAWLTGWFSGFQAGMLTETAVLVFLLFLWKSNQK